MQDLRKDASAAPDVTAAALLSNDGGATLHQAFLLALEDRLRPLADPERIQYEAAQALGRYLRADRVGYAEDAGDGETVIVTRNYTDGVPGIEGRYRYDDYGPDLVRALRAGRTVVRPDIQRDAGLSQPEKDAHAVLQLGATVNVPLVKDNRLVALLFMHARHARAWTAADVALLESVAARTWDAVERARAEQRLRDSEALHRTLFDAIDEGLVVGELIFDAAGAAVDYRWLQVNAAAQRLGRHEIAAGKCMRAVAPDAADEWVARVERVVRSGLPERVEYFDAVLGRWLDVFVSRVGGAGSARAAMAFKDVTERHRAEASLREREERQAFLLRLADALRPLADPDVVQAETARLLGQHLRVNRAAYVELEGGDLMMRGAYVDGVPPPPERYTRLLDEASVTELFRDGDVVAVDDIDADPRLTPSDRVGLHAAQVRAFIGVRLSAGGRWSAGFGVQQAVPRRWSQYEHDLVREVAERAWDAVERARAEAQVRTADRRKDEFLATLAHELRNPLAPLRNGLHIARAAARRDAALAPTLTPTLDIMDRQLTHLVRLVDDLLDIGRISAGKLALRREPVRLADVLQASIDASRAAFDDAGHVLDVAIDRAGPAVIGDVDRLAQVFTNLLSNAARYTPAGGKVTLRLDHEPQWEVVRVQDTGIGIAPEDLPRVFDLFSQVRVNQGRASGKVGHGGGLGIGLSLVKTLVAMHGGDVEAASAGIGRGSAFTVRLPVATAQQADAAGAPADTASEEHATRRRVLVVDDNVDAAATLAQLVQLLGHETTVVHDGLQALEAAGGRSFDVVLLDLGMPRLDGIETARRLRAAPGGAHLTIAAVTGWGQDADRARTREAGFDRHLVKPVAIDALLQVLELQAH